MFDYAMYSKYKKIICVSKENESSFKKANDLIGKTLPTYIIKDITDSLLVKKMSFENTDFKMDINQINILTVGRLAKAKGIHLAIEACKIIKSKGVKVKWYVIGEGPERNELEKRINQYNLENSFLIRI